MKMHMIMPISDMRYRIRVKAFLKEFLQGIAPIIDRRYRVASGKRCVPFFVCALAIADGR